MTVHLPVLEYLQKQIKGTLPTGAKTWMNYPSPISKLLGFKIVEIDKGYAKLQMTADIALHGNQQGTIHGGILCELADATIGTAHSTVIEEGESLTSVDIKVNFFRPVWSSEITAVARQIQHGKTITYYQCEIFREDNKLIAMAHSTIMTLRGQAAEGR